MKIIWRKVKIRFLQDLDISGKVQANKGEIREAQIFDGYCYIDFGVAGIAKAPLADMAGKLEIIEGGTE